MEEVKKDIHRYKIDDLYTYLINKKDFELMLVYNLFDGINYTYFDVNNMNDINSFWIIQSLEYSVFNVESLTFIDDCNYLTLKGNWIVLRSDTDFYRISTIFEKKGYAFFVKNIFLALLPEEYEFIKYLNQFSYTNELLTYSNKISKGNIFLHDNGIYALEFLVDIYCNKDLNSNWDDDNHYNLKILFGNTVISGVRHCNWDTLQASEAGMIFLCKDSDVNKMIFNILNCSKKFVSSKDTRNNLSKIYNMLINY